MSTLAITKAYRRYAGVYDRLFGTVFAQGRRMAVQLSTPTAGRKVLEVGVGTGLSLPAYAPETEVWGIDLSEHMLERARARVVRDNLTHVKDLRVMDAEATEFADGTFDTVVAMYVVSVVANPAKMFREISRICRPGGDIIVVNHFASTHWLLQAMERSLAPLSGVIGFHPHYSMSDMLDDSRLQLQAVHDVNWFGYWKLAHFHNTPVHSAAAALEPAYAPRFDVDAKRA